MKTIAELQAIRDKAIKEMEVRKQTDGYRVVVGMATCGISAGARPVLAAITEEVVGKRNLKNVTISQTGCIGVCRLEPIVEVYNPDGEKVTYVKVTPEKVSRIVTEHLVNGKPVTEYTIGSVK